MGLTTYPLLSRPVTRVTRAWSNFRYRRHLRVNESFRQRQLSSSVRPLTMLPRSLFSRKTTLVYVSAGTLAVAGGGYYYLNSGPAFPVSTRESRKPPPPWLPPSRAQNLAVLKASGSGSQDAKLDLLVIGGGATGAGVAVDAASRGLKVALVERDDFSSGMALRIDG
jgi:hypothetical protein